MDHVNSTTEEAITTVNSTETDSPTEAMTTTNITEAPPATTEATGTEAIDNSTGYKKKTMSFEYE